MPAFYSVFREADHAYIAQEYIEGQNLDELVRRTGLVAEQQVIEWGLALCDLLGYLHGQPDAPLIYRDLKPANILLRTGDRRLVVVDFGIAKHSRPGEVGTVIGTPGYAPPEQYQGLADARSDVYALGATLHRLLTGYDPEKGQPFTFPPAQSLNPIVSPALADVVARAVLLEPAARYPSMQQFAAELRAAGRLRVRKIIKVAS
jgi:serine/threonine protein kinase